MLRWNDDLQREVCVGPRSKPQLVLEIYRRNPNRQPLEIARFLGTTERYVQTVIRKGAPLTGHGYKVMWGETYTWDGDDWRPIGLASRVRAPRRSLL